MMYRISPKSFKLQADVVLEVVSAHDEPPISARPENIITPDEDDDSAIQTPPTTGITGGRTSTSSFPRRSTDLDSCRSTTSSRSSIRASSESAHTHTHTHTHTPKHSSESARKQSQEATPRARTTGTAAAAGKDDDEDDWSPFQANSAANFPASQTPTIPGSSSTRHTHTYVSSKVNADAGGLGQHGIMASNEILRQEMIHRLELLSAEQEERLNLILTACRSRPPR
jgi:hypothetical protein